MEGGKTHPGITRARATQGQRDGLFTSKTGRFLFIKYNAKLVVDNTVEPLRFCETYRYKNCQNEC